MQRQQLCQQRCQRAPPAWAQPPTRPAVASQLGAPRRRRRSLTLPPPHLAPACSTSATMPFETVWNQHPKEYGKGSRRCRVCSNQGGLIRKYGMNICRQCFRECEPGCCLGARSWWLPAAWSALACRVGGVLAYTIDRLAKDVVISHIWPHVQQHLAPPHSHHLSSPDVPGRRRQGHWLCQVPLSYDGAAVPWPPVCEPPCPLREPGAWFTLV